MEYGMKNIAILVRRHNTTENAAKRHLPQTCSDLRLNWIQEKDFKSRNMRNV